VVIEVRRFACVKAVPPHSAGTPTRAVHDAKCRSSIAGNARNQSVPIPHQIRRVQCVAAWQEHVENEYFTLSAERTLQAGGCGATLCRPAAFIARANPVRPTFSASTTGPLSVRGCSDRMDLFSQSAPTPAALLSLWNGERATKRPRKHQMPIRYMI